MDPKTGEITLLAPVLDPSDSSRIHSLDAETTPKYVLTIEATDNGEPDPRTDVTFVTIGVVDVNDNAPVFEKNAYSKITTETAPEAVRMRLAELRASDIDTGFNGGVQYAITAGNDDVDFEINKTSGTVDLISATCATKKDKYVIEVEARDRGLPSRADTAEVILLVTETNKYSPVFSQVTYVNGSVLEDTLVGSYITAVDATDADCGGRDTQEIRFRIVEGAVSTFAIDPKTGVISLVKKLDRETRASYKTAVEASDTWKGDPRTGTAVVEVVVVDVIDEPPVFSQARYQKELDETSPIGTQVAQLKAVDPHLRDVLEYSKLNSERTLRCKCQCPSYRS